MSRLERAIEFIEKMEGVLIGETFMKGIEGKKKYRYANIRCKNGHEWCTQVDFLSKQRWCTVCKNTTKNTVYLEKLTTVSHQKNGKIVSDIYRKNGKNMIKIRCSEGHEWESTIHNIMSLGQWCRKCYGTAKLTIDEVRTTVENRGGTLLTDVIGNNRTRIKIQCGFEDHPPFEVIIGNMNFGAWCIKCRRTNVREELIRAIFVEAFNGKLFNSTRKETFTQGLELDGYNSDLKLAWEHNGRQHYEYIQHFHRCIDVFDAQKERDYRKQRLCTEAGVTLLIFRYDIPISQLRNHVRQKIIDVGYTDLAPPLGNDTFLYDKIRCAGPKSVQCFNAIEEVVKQKKGTVISSRYLGADVKMRFKCCVSEHPEFDMMPSHILNGKFCRLCGFMRSAAKNSTPIDVITKRIAVYGWKLDTVSRERGYPIITYRKCNNKDHKQYTISVNTLCVIEKRENKNGVIHNTYPCPDCNPKTT